MHKLVGICPPSFVSQSVLDGMKPKINIDFIHLEIPHDLGKYELLESNGVVHL